MDTRNISWQTISILDFVLPERKIDCFRIPLRVQATRLNFTPFVGLLSSSRLTSSIHAWGIVGRAFLRLERVLPRDGAGDCCVYVRKLACRQIHQGDGACL
jgi:hypothetical protein